MLLMPESSPHIDHIQDDHEYHDMSERLRILYRAIIQLIVIKEEYEEKIDEYLKLKDSKHEHRA